MASSSHVVDRLHNWTLSLQNTELSGGQGPIFNMLLFLLGVQGGKKKKDRNKNTAVMSWPTEDGECEQKVLEHLGAD